MKKTIAMLLTLAILSGICTACDAEPEAAYKIGLLPLNVDTERWRLVTEGAQQAASELDAALVDLLAQAEEDTLPEEWIRQAVAARCQALIVSGHDGSDGTAEALREAAEAGIRVIRADSDLEAEAAATFSVDQKAMGRAAAEAMLYALDAKKIMDGTIGIISPNSGSAAAQREAGFREAFAGKSYTLLETRYDGKNFARAGNIAAEQIAQGSVGIFCGGLEGIQGAGAAAKAANSNTVVVGCGGARDLEELLKEGFVRAVALPDDAALGYESVAAAVSLLKEEAAEAEKMIPGVTILESEAPVVGNRDYKIALIRANPMDPDGATLAAGANRAAGELGCALTDLSPVFPNEARQLQQIAAATSGGFHAIITSGSASEEIAAALRAARNAGVKVICVSPADGQTADIDFAMDQQAAGKAAGEAMLAELKNRGIQEGGIGVINGKPDAEALQQREAGFREAFENTAYTLLETQFSEGDAAKAHTIAESCIWKPAVGVFCCDEASLIGAGNAVKARNANMAVVGVGDSAAVEELMKAGHVQAAVSADSDALGYEAVRAACAALNGEAASGTTLMMKFRRKS